VGRRERHAVDVPIMRGQNYVLRGDLQRRRSGVDASKPQRSTDSLGWIAGRVYELAVGGCAPCCRRRRAVDRSCWLGDTIEEFVPLLAGEDSSSIATSYRTSSLRLELRRLTEVEPLEGGILTPKVDSGEGRAVG